MDAPHVTITILDVSLSLVHIPRSRTAELTRPIVGQLLRKNPKFLNLTANELELSLFVEDDALEEFETIARKDRQKWRRREMASESIAAAAHRHRRAHLAGPALHPVEISLDKWRVLQIDSHEDSLSKSGSRVRELSAPLAAAGISILYQSSYLSDFIFVKASRLGAVMELLDAAGFTFYNADPSLFSQNELNEINRLAKLRMEANGYGISIQGSPGTMSPAVLSRTRSPSMASLTALSFALSRQATLEDTTELERNNRGPTSSSSGRQMKKSMSPASAPVDVLSPDVACVGLNDNAVGIWTLKILTLVAYPELIPIQSSSSYAPIIQSAHESHMHMLYDPVPSDPRVRSASPDLIPSSQGAAYDSALEDVVPSKQFQKRSRSYPNGSEEHSSHDSSSSPTSLSSCSDSDDEDQYFSSPSPYTKRRDGSESSLLSGLSTASGRSLPDRLDSYLASGRLSQPLTSTATDGSPPAPSRADQASSNPTNQNSIRVVKKEPLRVPFFSFTRTSEGSSLTTDLRVLSALFSSDERHMVICSDSLLETGDALNELGTNAGERQAPVGDSRMIFDLDDEADLFVMEDEDARAPGLMKCLQIDLHRFGLEKHGLIHRFSGILDENGINHMYSSTYKTANLLVDKENALRAQHLLRTC